MTYGDIVDNVCKKCKYYKSDMGICKKEILPVERIIDRATCEEIYKYVQKWLKEKNNN